MSQQTSPGSISEQTRRPNRLAQETSPYLLQHAYNPVDWFPWSPEALQQARDLNRPILLSIGYSSCHWCHVMERESFENEQIAALMNQDFVCIKVDREERPDLDEIYMQATLAMNQGQGGWPMTVFLTPEQEPIFAGTYFPPTDRWGRPGFSTVLRKVADLWQTDPDGLRRQAAHLTEQLKQSMRAVSAMAVGEAEMEAAVTQFAEAFDARHGGFGGAPKFPPATGLTFLLHRYQKSNVAHTLTMVRKTLDAMAAGGIYDQIGGGFARYSTDDRWLVPHFEKMLYDNALLARVYAEAFNLTGEAMYRRIAAETLDYILREMTAPEGGFYSATDADSEGVEGKFFVWTPDEVVSALQAGRPKSNASAAAEDARRLCAYYDITPAGNWHEPVAHEGDHGPRSIPHVPRSREEVASQLGIQPDELRRTIERTRPVLYEARRQRIPPGLDDKILTSWNGMMISAMAEASRVLGEPRFRQAAERAADFLLKTMRQPSGRLLRTYRAGKAHLAACLDDYAYLAEGLIDLYEAGADERYLREAVRLAERIVSDFSDEEQGGFFTTATDHEKLIVRTKEGPDGAIPSGNAVAASVLARLSSHYGREDFREAAVRAIRAYGSQISRYPRAFAKSLIVLELLLEGPVELALIGSPQDSGYQALRARVDQHYLPNRIIAHHDPARSGSLSDHPLLKGRALVGGRAALYVCRNFACQRPITDPAEVSAALTAMPTESAAQRPVAGSGSKVLAAKRLAGHATTGGTAKHAVRFVNRPSVGFAGQAYVRLGTTGLTASRLGFGGYRVTIDEVEHRQALWKALTEGCNVIDTSINYTDGESERLIGSVLTDLVKAEAIARDEIIVISKIGYVQGQSLKVAEAREQAGRPYPEMVKYGEGIWHCIHPEFLEDQLALSLDRLGLETLDVCLLHNPEYFFSDAKHRGKTGLSKLREEFYERVAAAFAYFETQVAAGRLRSYGVSSNTSTSAPEDPEATSLSRFLDAAQRAAAQVGAREHHFTVLQCPMNLFEAGALLTPNTGPNEQQTVLELAQTAGIAVLVNRPLNAIPKARDGHASPMIRLADPVLEPPGPSFESLQEKVAALEQEYRREFAPHVQTSGQGMPPDDYFRWADEVSRVRPLVVNLEHWDQIENQMVAPHLNQVLRALGQHLTSERAGELSERWQAWRDRYLPELLALLRAVRREATLKSREKIATISRVVDPLLPESRRKVPLSRKALWALISTSGVTCVLNGMRTEAYVEDSLEILRWDPLPEPRRVYEAIQALAAV